MIILGALGICDTAVVSLYSNPNIGTLLPAILGAPLLVIGVFYKPAAKYFKTNSGKWLKRILIAGYGIYALMLAIIVPMLYSNGHREAAPDADAVIVLGCGVHGEQLSYALSKRCETALKYAKDNPQTLIILSGGQGAGESIAEAEAMRRFFVSRGIDEKRLRMESESDSTYTNFKNSKALLDEEFKDGYSAVFVTTEFHVMRSEYVAASVGLNVEGIGAPGHFLITPNDYMRETLAIAAYFVMGRL